MVFINSGGKFRGSAGGGLGCLAIGVVGLIVAFYVLRGLFQLLWWAAPALLVLALIINWRSVANTGKWMIGQVRTAPLRGLLLIVLSIIAFPIFSLFLFGQALGLRRLERFRAQFGEPGKAVEQKGEFIDYEELESRPKKPLKEPGRSGQDYDF